MDENDKKTIEQLTKDYASASEQLKNVPEMAQKLTELTKSFEAITQQIKDNAERKGAMVETITGSYEEDKRLSVGSLLKAMHAHALADCRDPDASLGRLKLNDEVSCKRYGYTGIEKELGEHLLTKSGTYGLASLDDAGGVFIPHDLLGDYIKKLRPNERAIFDAGAKLTDLPAGTGVLTIPVQKTLASATSVDESGQLVQTGLDWGMKTLTPHRIGNASLVSKRLLFSAAKYEQILIQELLYGIWREVQRQVLYGTGTKGEISGIATDGAFTKVYAGNSYGTSAGSAGKILTFADANMMEDVLAQANGRTDGFAIIAQPQVIRNMKNSIINSNATFSLIPDSTLASDANLKAALGVNRTFHRLTDVTKGLTVGSSSGTCSHVWFGQFDNVEVVTWGGVQVKVSAEAVVGGKSAFERNSLALAADLNYDALYRQTAELFRIEDALTTSSI